MEEKKKINQVRFEELRSKGFPKGCLDHCYLDGIIIEKLPEEFQISHSRLSECWIQKFSADSEYSCAVTPQVRQTGNRLSGLAGTAYASLLT